LARQPAVTNTKFSVADYAQKCYNSGMENREPNLKLRALKEIGFVSLIVAGGEK
jgi:hypothetical protein